MAQNVPEWLMPYLDAAPASYSPFAPTQSQGYDRLPGVQSHAYYNDKYGLAPLTNYQGQNVSLDPALADQQLFPGHQDKVEEVAQGNQCRPGFVWNGNACVPAVIPDDDNTVTPLTKQQQILHNIRTGTGNIGGTDAPTNDFRYLQTTAGELQRAADAAASGNPISNAFGKFFENSFLGKATGYDHEASKAEKAAALNRAAGHNAAAARLQAQADYYQQQDDDDGPQGNSYSLEDVAQETVDAYADSGHEDYSWDFNKGGMVGNPMSISQVMGFNGGGMVPQMNYGGKVAGYNDGGMPHPFEREGSQFDTVKADLTPGEFVVDADSAHQFQPILEKINAWEPGDDMQSMMTDIFNTMEDVTVTKKHENGNSMTFKSPSGQKMVDLFKNGGM